jgi:preprotein translocase subunit SecF
VFQILKSSNFDFMKYRNPVLIASVVVVAISIVLIVTPGPKMGIEFTGGTELQVRFSETPNVAAIRKALEDAGLENRTVTTIGQPEENEIYIRLGTQPADGALLESPADQKRNDTVSRATDALRASTGQSRLDGDLNFLDQSSITDLLQPEIDRVAAGLIADGIVSLREESVIFHTVQDVSAAPGMTPEALATLTTKAQVGPMAVRSQSFIGPTIGEELKDKAGLAILGSLLGMLIYIWIRFQIQWGLAAVVALAHDTIIALGLFSIFGFEMSLPVVAAFLTLIGYSANDTVVVFDRIRENLKIHAGRSLESTINLSLNQTLSRTIITSGLTLIVVMGLLFFGGAALQPFAFVLTAGVIVGTYSSIYVASPFLLIWKRILDSRSGKSGKARSTVAASGAGTRVATKVRTPSAG